MAGCANTTFKVAAHGETNGIRYFAPASFILIKPDYTKSTATVEFLTLPDTTRLFAVDTYSWLASNNTKIDFTNGMIAKAVSDTDSVKVPVATLQAISASVQQAMKAAAAAAAASAAKSAARKKTTLPPAAPPVFLFYNTGTTLTQIYPNPRTGGQS